MSELLIVKTLVDHYFQERSDGKKGRFIASFELPYCPVYQCECCGSFGSGLRIRYSPKDRQLLCMSCCYELQPVHEVTMEILELESLTRKLMRVKHVH